MARLASIMPPSPGKEARQGARKFSAGQGPSPGCSGGLVGKFMQIYASPVVLSEAYGRMDKLCYFKPCHIASVCPLQGRIEHKAIKQMAAIAANLSGESLTYKGLAA